MRRLVFCAVCFVLFAFGGCAKADTGIDNVITEVKDNITKDNTPSFGSTMQDAYCDEILEKAAPDFLGYHPLEKSFLFWAESNYGPNLLESIVKDGNFEVRDVWTEKTGCTIHALWAMYCNDTGISSDTTGRLLIRKEKSQKDKDKPVVLTFGGDFSMHEGSATLDYLNYAAEGDLSKCFSKDLLKEMKGADLFVVNNDFSYAEKDRKAKNINPRRSDPKNAKKLKKAGIDVVNMANDHVFDYEKAGLLDSLKALDDAKVSHIGAGRGINEAQNPLYYVAGGRCIALISLSQTDFDGDYSREASEGVTGVYKGTDFEKVYTLIDRAKVNADTVIAYVHWGIEGNVYISQEQEAMARDMVDAGVDAIVGCHSHCLEGIEDLDGVPVFYSLGDFWYAPTAGMPAAYYSGMAKLKINSKGEIKSYFLPTKFVEGVTSKASEDEVPYLNSFMEEVSQTTKITKKGKVLNRFE